MGLILNEFNEYKDKYKDYMPKDVYDILCTTTSNRAQMLEPNAEDRKKYFVEGLEDLSLAIFNLLYSGRGYYIMNYAHQFKVNRKAAGFKTKEDLVHYALWVVENFINRKDNTIKYLEELKLNSVGKTDEEMMKEVMIEQKLNEELKEVTFNMKNEEDFQRRLVLLDVLKEHETLSYYLLSSFSFYQIVDDIYNALENIPNMLDFNVPPKPMKQNIWESSMV